jgi:membrane-bound serine protease (ClpP class)
MTPVAIVVALMVLGMVLLVAEVAIIPGFGVAGMSAAALIIGGAVYAGATFGLSWGVGSLLLSGAATWAILSIVPRTRAGRALVLDAALKSPPASAIVEGQEGVALTALRPAGAAQIGGQRVDVVADGGFVDAGRAVRVVVVEGARIVVAPV